MKKLILFLLFSILFILNILNIANATLIDKYFDYGSTSNVTDINLNGNLDNIINIINGNLDNTNIKSGYRLYEALGTLPAAGTQGRTVFYTIDNTLNFDTGSQWYSAITLIRPPTQGDIVYYNGTNWVSLSTGTQGQSLTTAGASANPSWAGLTTQGDIEYHNGTTRTRLGAGTSGQFLKTQGAGANPTWAADNNMSNVIFDWHGIETMTANQDGLYIGTAIQPNISTAGADLVMAFLGVYGSTYQTFFNSQFIKIAGISTITIHSRMWCSTNNTATLSVDIGGQSNTVSVTSETAAWATTATIDVSGLTNGTIYAITIQLKSSSATTSVYCSDIVLTAS